MKRLSQLRRVSPRVGIGLLIIAWGLWYIYSPPGVVHLPWQTDFPAAQALARQTGRRIFMDFTGSDYCAPCQRLQKEVFSTVEFAAYAATNLVLVEVDFPAWKELPKAQQEANQALSDKFKVEGFPTLILLNSEGKELGRFTDVAARTPREFIQLLEALPKK
jgi:protein disulfide-isomerase